MLTYRMVGQRLMKEVDILSFLSLFTRNIEKYTQILMIIFMSFNIRKIINIQIKVMKLLENTSTKFPINLPAHSDPSIPHHSNSSFKSSICR
jgi:hypothetical protein